MSIARQLLHWSPRVLAIVAILFVSMFALDAFGHGKPFFEELLDFLMHRIPSYWLIALLIIAWKWEMVGAILFALLGFGVMPWLWQHNYAMNQSVWMTTLVLATIALPFVVVGALFILNAYFKKRDKSV